MYRFLSVLIFLFMFLAGNIFSCISCVCLAAAATEPAAVKNFKRGTGHRVRAPFALNVSGLTNPGGMAILMKYTKTL